MYCALTLCDPSITICMSHCPACPVAPINPKTHLGSPWSNQIPRRRKLLPLPLQGWQQLPIQALCTLSKARAPDPVRPLRPPTHLRMTTMNVMRQSRKTGVKELQFQPQWWLLIHGTASPRRLMPQVQTLPLVEEARPAQPVLGAPRARNVWHPVYHSQPPVTKVRKCQLAESLHCTKTEQIFACINIFMD